MSMDWNVHRLKNPYDEVLSAVDDFFYQKNPSTATLMKGVCGPQKELC